MNNGFKLYPSNKHQLNVIASEMSSHRSKPQSPPPESKNLDIMAVQEMSIDLNKSRQQVN